VSSGLLSACALRGLVKRPRPRACSLPRERRRAVPARWRSPLRPSRGCSWARRGPRPRQSATRSHGAVAEAGRRLGRPARRGRARRPSSLPSASGLLSDARAACAWPGAHHVPRGGPVFSVHALRHRQEPAPAQGRGREAAGLRDGAGPGARRVQVSQRPVPNAVGARGPRQPGRRLSPLCPAQVLFARWSQAEAAADNLDGVSLPQAGGAIGRPLVVHFANPRRAPPGQPAEPGVAPRKLFVGQARHLAVADGGRSTSVPFARPLVMPARDGPPCARSSLIGDASGGCASCLSRLRAARCIAPLPRRHGAGGVAQGRARAPPGALQRSGAGAHAARRCRGTFRRMRCAPSSSRTARLST